METRNRARTSRTINAREWDRKNVARTAEELTSIAMQSGDPRLIRRANKLQRKARKMARYDA